MFTDDTDYVVEEYIKPIKVGKRLINDERADILGNFDDDDDKFKKKNVKIAHKNDSEENPFIDDDDDNNYESDTENGTNSNKEEEKEEDKPDEESSTSQDEDEMVENNNLEPNSILDIEQNSSTETDQHENGKPNKNIKKKKLKTEESTKSKGLTNDQVQSLIRGASKKDRFVLYVTNLSYSTTRDSLIEFFSAAGEVKSIRIPKVRRSAFAFVEMNDIKGFTVGLIYFFDRSKLLFLIILFIFFNSLECIGAAQSKYR